MTKAKKASLLVVEDEESLREALKLNLELEGYEITTADNGPAVIKLVKNEYFDLIILDIMLPEMDGLEVLRRLRSGGAPGLPVIMLTAHGDEVDRQDGVVHEVDVEPQLLHPLPPPPKSAGADTQVGAE